MLNFVFKTTPLVLTYSVNSGSETIITYPPTQGTYSVRACICAGVSAGPVSYTTNLRLCATHPCLRLQSPIQVPATGDVSVRVTLARPQRAAIAGEAAPNGWVDIGKMTWQVWAQTDSQGIHACQVATYSSPQAMQLQQGWQDNSADMPTGTPKVPPASPIIFDVRLAVGS